MRTMIFCAALAVARLSANAAPLTLPDLLAGKIVPLNLPLKSLDAAWVRFELTGGDEFELYLAMMSQGRAGMNTPLFSRGQTITLAGETYLVAYRQEVPPLDLSTMMGRRDQGPARQLLTVDTLVNLSLINVRNIGSLLDLQPFNLAAELERAKQADIHVPPPGARDQSMANIRQLLIAILMYAQDHDQQMPPIENLAALKGILNMPEAIWRHPMEGMSYAVNVNLSNKALGNFDQPNEVIVIYEPTPWPDGMHVVGYLDGHVETMRDERWQELRARAGIP